jgi:hypothetical protein
MLDNIAINLYSDRIAAIEIHNRMWMDTLCYNAEAYQRWLTFPGDANPSRLYIDGHRDPSYYWTWQDSIVNRMNKPATVTIRMTGFYNTGNGSGSITGVYRNDSSAAITGQVMFVITEDSVYYMDSLGGQAKQWHNHTPRDYIPGPLGTIFTIPPGDSVIYTQPFTISLPVRYQYCSIVTYIQDTVLGPDLVTKNIYQGGKVKIAQLVGTAEDRIRTDPVAHDLQVVPNPCARQAEFIVDIPSTGPFTISIYNIAGNLVRRLTGTGTAGRKQFLFWDLKDEHGKSGSGVYFYVFKIPTAAAITGKIIIK